MLVFGAVLFILLLLAAIAGWWVQLHTRNATHADLIWAWGLGAAALAWLVAGDGELLPRIAAGILVAVWSLRLGLHILGRIVSEPEDGRYQALRVRLGDRAPLWLLPLFLVQAPLAWFFSLPFMVLAGHPGGDAIAWVLVGFLLGIFALAGEALADHQLARFRADPANGGRTCRQGLWRYSRHPNYFFEWLHWCSYPLMATGAPGGAWVWLAPVVMFAFLWWITGIPWTEQQAVRSRGEDYRRYQRETPIFFPWRPKHDH